MLVLESAESKKARIEIVTSDRAMCIVSTLYYEVCCFVVGFLVKLFN